MAYPEHVDTKRKQVPLVLVSNQINSPAQYQSDITEDRSPRLDYVEIARRLGADTIGYGLFNAAWYSLALKLEKPAKLDIIETLYASRKFSEYNLLLSTSERAAIPLAILLQLGGFQKPHFLISHHISSPRKKLLFRLWPLHQRFSHIFFVSKAQADYAVNDLGISPKQVDFLYDKVDHKFFRPLGQSPGDFILAVGQEQRDYPSLVKALEGTGIKLVIVASSPWSLFPVKIPKNADSDVEILQNLSFVELRELYARAKMVVVPLHANNYAAGVNTILEGMAMGKAVIASYTLGTRDYLKNRETGRYCPPEDPGALRDRILSNWDNPRELSRLGDNARSAVEEYLNLDTYVSMIVDTIRIQIESNSRSKLYP